MWPRIAANHIYNVLKKVTQWIKLAVERLIVEDGMRDQIHMILVEWLENAETNALKELGRLVEDEQRTPLTYNHYYTDNVQKNRVEVAKMTMGKDIRTELKNQGTLSFDGKIGVDLEKVVVPVQAHITVDMDEQACNNAITELRSYYKVRRNPILIQVHIMLTQFQVAMKTFVDNVARQVIERHIMAPLPTAFCPNSVSQLSDEDLFQIGSESEKQIARRATLAAEVQGLKKSLKDLQKPV